MAGNLKPVRNQRFLFWASKNLIPIAILVAGLLIAGALVYLNKGKVEILSPQQAAEKAINYINQNLLTEGITASLINVVEENGVYKFRLKIGDQEYDSYISKNGKLLFAEGIDLEEEAPIAQAPETEAPQSSLENAISPEELTKFIGCLEKVDFVIYGANWCGWTKKLVEMLGGFDMVKPIYVECTEEEKLCQEKEITGYPTILIKGGQYQEARTFEKIAAATGCELPAGAESISGESSEAGACQ